MLAEKKISECVAPRTIIGHLNTNFVRPLSCSMLSKIHCFVDTFAWYIPYLHGFRPTS